MYTELHEIFFGEFLIILTGWLERLVKNTGGYQTAVLRNLTPELVRQLNFVRNKTSCVVDFWLDNILGVILQNLQWIVPFHIMLQRGIYLRVRT
jgi:hypothetical protein